MTPDSPTPSGLALLCDTGGRILQVFADRLGLADHFSTGCLFSACMASGSVGKSLSFLEQIRQRQATFEWELEIASVGRKLCFDGCLADGHLLVLGAPSSPELLGFLQHLLRLDHPDVDSLRLPLNQLSLKENEAGRFQHEFYNELTRLNNELINTQRELARRNIELERLNRLKTEFLGMAAHDLRAPIGVILWYSEFLREEGAEVFTSTQLEFISTIRSSSEFMLHLINDFLDVSAIESGKLNLNRRPSDLRQLLERHVGLNAVLAQKKRIRIALEVEGALPTLSVDEGKIAQVLNNLISNGVKFSQPGSDVVVHAAPEYGGVRIAVHDHGPGIAENERGNLFKAFSRTSVRSTAGEGSTGLGLAISRKIVEGHGGRIWVESQVGVGSQFLFTLPPEAPNTS